MADPIAGLPYWEIRFDTDGSLLDDGGLPAGLPASGVTELFVFSHGWNTSPASAHDLYQAIFTELARQIPLHAPSLQGRTGTVGVYWPSLLFPEDDPGAPATPSTGAQLAAALAPAFPRQQQQALATVGGLLDAAPPNAASLQQAHGLIGSLVTSPPLAPEDSGEQAVVSGSTADVFTSLSRLTTSASDAEGLPDPFTELWHGAREALRTASYYEMKNRAGVVGRQGLGPLLGRIAADGLRVHLLGHSFGARLVSFALAGLPEGTTTPVKSLCLIQGAFSHFTFATPLPIDSSRNGFLAGFANRVDGPMLATFSQYDRAVGWWYPAASMISQSDSEAAEDLLYRWGGMGHDGYQQGGTEQVTLQNEGTPYAFKAGGFYDLDSDAVIRADLSPFSGAHSDIRHPEVVWAVLAGATTNGSGSA